MSPSEITSLVTTVGFPIVAVWFLAAFTKSRIEASEKISIEREREASIREQQLVKRINDLEDHITDQLVAAVNESKDVMADCSATLRACTAALERHTDRMKV